MTLTIPPDFDETVDQLIKVKAEALAKNDMGGHPYMKSCDLANKAILALLRANPHLYDYETRMHFAMQERIKSNPK